MVAINKNKRQCGVIVTLFLVSIKGSLLNMSGRLSVRGCTAQPFSTALPTKSSSISGKEDKAVLGKRSGYLFKVRSLRIWESCRTQCRVRSCVCLGCTRRGWGAAFAHLQQPCPRHCRTACEVLFISLRTVVAPFSSSSLPGKRSLVRSHFGSP